MSGIFHSPMTVGSVIRQAQYLHHPHIHHPQRPSVLNSTCVTRVDTLQLGQHWRIENFASLMKLTMPGHCLRSSTFKDPALPDASWQLCLYPGGKRFENANNVSLFLKMSSTSPTRELRIKVEYRFYFLNDRDVPLFSNVNVGEFHAKPPKNGHSWGLRNIPKQKVMNCIRSDGSLVISCHIELIPDIDHTKCVTNRKLKKMETRAINSQFINRQLEALRRGFMADCVLECNGYSISVNKFVLMVHSNVFKAMFSHDCLVESTERKVIIEDADVDAVRLMVQYMYTGEVDLGTHAEGVLLLAERYQIQELKELCEEQLCAAVDRYNIGEMLYLADLYNCQELCNAIVQVLRTNRTYVMSSPAWLVLKETNPRLISDIMEKALFGVCESPPSKRIRSDAMNTEATDDDSN